MADAQTARTYVHAATVCSTLETGIRIGISRAQRAIEEAQAELRHMLNLLNEGRAARGLPSLDSGTVNGAERGMND